MQPTHYFYISDPCNLIEELGEDYLDYTVRFGTNLHHDLIQAHRVNLRCTLASWSISPFNNPVYRAASFISLNQTNGLYQMTQQTTPSNNDNMKNIYNVCYRDLFINNYHAKIHEHKLTSYSSNDARMISKETFDELFSKSNVRYVSGNMDGSENCSFESFIDSHTFFSCCYNKKEDTYYLRNYFTHDEEVQAYFSTLSFLKEPPLVSWVTGVNNDGSLDIDYLPIEKPKTVFDSFYPWLNGTSLDEFLDQYLASDESILLLYGQHGSGKSNLLKYLLHKSGQHALITYQDDIRDLDKMFSNFIKGKERYLIIEDADEFLTKREHGNKSMKRLLNIADGLTSNKDKKVIFTSNISNLLDIDEALLRDGRCYATVKFEKIPVEHLPIIAADLKLDITGLPQIEYSLAELFAMKKNKFKLKGEKPQKGFGFNFK